MGGWYVEETGSQRPAMADVVKQIEGIMEIAGLNSNAESAANSAGYDEGSRGSEHPYTNDSLLLIVVTISQQRWIPSRKSAGISNDLVCC
ncbi:hypothetical protein L1887_24157 [Cichorium endivia]|nr:hypothetical protein L1887_24157 [Cichorium endivia]